MNIPIYNKDQDKVSPGLYFCLFHGFKTLKQRQKAGDAGVWGSDGPMIGPLKFVHTTYGDNIKINFSNPGDAKKYGLNPEDMLSLTVDDKKNTVDSDCIHFKGINYGDWTVCNFPVKD